MPVMDGYEAAKMIREHEKKYNLQPISIIALTADAFESNKEKCLSEGMNDIITKPIEINDLINKLNKYIPARENIEEISKQNFVEQKSSDKTIEQEFLDKEKIIKNVANELGLEKEDVEDLINTFFNDFIKQKEMLKSAIDNEDYVQVNEIAHSIAGASANLRIDEISTQSRALNNLLRDKESFEESDLIKAKELINEILLIDII